MKILLFALPSLLFLSSCTSVHSGGSYGGVVWEHFSDKSYSKVVRLANEHCNAFGKNAEIVDKKINATFESEYDEYRFRCLNNQQDTYNLNTPAQTPIATQPISPAAPKISLDQSKQKCASLGFQAGTESFANCVLKLSR